MIDDAVVLFFVLGIAAVADRLARNVLDTHAPHYAVTNSAATQE